MHVVLVHPNYHSGGAEIAGNWPPAWAAYLAGGLKSAGFDKVTFIDAMTDDLSDEVLEQKLRDANPDVIGVTSITPSIYKAENVLKIAERAIPNAVRVLGGVHATFMFKQVLSEAPWIDVIVRGEGEEIFVNLVRAVDEGRWPADRATIKGLAYREGTEIVATQAAPTIKDLDGIMPDWDILTWSKYIYVPLGVRVAIPNMARGCPFTCSFCSQWKFWRDYRVRDPKKVVDEIEKLVNDHNVGFFILADEEPTINKKKFTEFCEELIARGLPDKVKWGINTRVTDIYRDRDDLKMWRKAGLVHVSLGTEAAAQLKLDRFNKETKVAQNKEAIRLLRRELAVPIGPAERGDGTLVLLPVNAADRVAVESESRDQAQRLQRAIGGAARQPCVGVGRAGSGVMLLRQGLDEAEQALGLGRSLFGPGHLTHIVDLGVHRLLSPLARSGDLASFRQEHLGALEEYDRQAGAELVHTLRAYFVSRASPTLTAKSLHLHRNSLLYRLQRIREVAGVDLDDPETQLRLEIALRARDLLDARS